MSDIDHTTHDPAAPAVPAPPPPSPRPPRGPSLAAILSVLGAFIVALYLGVTFAPRISHTAGEIWQIARGNSAGQPTTRSTHWYTCGMHPWVVLPHPGDCPICGMKLVPLDPAKFTGEVTINPVVAQDIGVRVSPVITGPLVRNVRTVGSVAYDETRVRDVNIKVNGWIEKLNVDYLGAEVKQGQRLFDLYSPELYAAQEEYLLAWKNRDKVGAAFVPDAASGARDLLSAARTKLEYFDITDKQIQELQQRGTPAKTMSILSPYSGVVIQKHANEGMKVDPGMLVYRIADLSKVWVMATLYEYQLPYVELGQSATMTLSYIPGQEFKGKVLYIYPYLNDKTRQVDVRLEFDNPGMLLKPGMYATIDLSSTLAKNRVLAPRSAVIDTGERKVAFVSLGDGRFQPRKVMTGAQNGDGMIEILDGLKPGEMVVTSGQFLIDSEANVREALARMIKGNLASGQKPTVATVGESELQSLPEAASKLIDQILNRYFAIGGRLVTDSTDGIAASARDIAGAVDQLLALEIPGQPHFWHRHEEAATIRGKALELADTPSLDDARLKYVDLSIAIAKLVKATGVPAEYGREVQQLHCPMYRQGQGGTIWLQPAGKVQNPYMGTTMPGCFDQREALPVTGNAADQGAKAAQPSHAGPTSQPSMPMHAATLSAAAQQQVDSLVTAYLKLQQELSRDQSRDAAAMMQQIRDSATALGSSPDAMLAAMSQKVVALAAAPADIAELRLAYKKLSPAVIALVKYAPPSKAATPSLYQIHCPMTKGDWLQTSRTVANPYYGSKMPTCGSVVDTIREPGKKTE